MPNPVVNPIYAGSRQDYTKRIKDVVGRLKVSVHQNIYDADFEYGKQPLRWEEFTANGGSITHLPGIGGCQMYLPSGDTNPGAITIRQSRPYHRYQPGKSMFMASAVNFGAPATNQLQRVGFFDDCNGAFFEQGPANGSNPAGMFCVIRTDSNYYPASTASTQPVYDVRVDYANWSDPHGIKNQLNWGEIQMLWVEYAWYGAGAIRFGVLLNGEQYILHEVGTGNNPAYGGGNVGASVSIVGTIASGSNSMTVTSAAGLGIGMVVSGNAAIPAGTYITNIVGTTLTLSANATAALSGATLGAIFAGAGAWSRTGNLPVRYEQRDTGTGAPATVFYHYGVSVIVEGRRDEQRGFTYSYGMSPNIPRRYVVPNYTRFPVLSIRGRVMGVQEVSNVGGPGDMKANATSSSATTLVFPTNGTASIGTVDKSTIQSGGVTITFKKGTNLPSSGGPNLTLAGFTTTAANVLNGTYTWSATPTAGTYRIASTSSIVVTPATLPSQISANGTVTAVTGNFATNQWVGRNIYYLGQDGNYYTAKISSNTATTIIFQDVITGGSLASAPAITGFTLVANSFSSGASTIVVPYTPALTTGVTVSGSGIAASTTISAIAPATTGFVQLTLNNATTSAQTTPTLTFAGSANQQFVIGVINRGQLIPQSLLVSSDSNCVVELIASTPGNPVALEVPNFQPLSSLGSPNSFATRDVSATNLVSDTGEVVYAFTTPAGGSGLLQIDLSNFFPLLNSINGNNPDILTVAVTTKATSTPGVAISSATSTGSVGTLTFVSPHNLNAGDQITLSGFTPSGWNNTFTITGTPDAFRVTISTSATSATNIGVSTFANGASVGAHLICQEAMS